MSEKRKLKVGVVGLGFAGKAHIDGYKNTENAELIAVCDVRRGESKGNC